MTTKDGGLRLLQVDDFGQDNRFGHPLVGWKSASAGDGSLVNTRGFAMLRVVVQKLMEGKLEDLYDQPMLVENVGSVVVPILDEKVGLVESFRMTGERIIAADPNYVANLNKNARWEELCATLGQWAWEVPRGIPPTKVLEKFESDEELALATARLEALDEAGFEMVDTRVVGRVNVNPTFFAHSQFVVSGRVASQKKHQPEDLEIIGKTRFFAPETIRAMVDDGNLQDGMTMAALSAAGFHY